MPHLTSKAFDENDNEKYGEFFSKKGKPSAASAADDGNSSEVSSLERF
jgi:hypothetical protein